MAFLDGEVTEFEREQIENHITRCTHCHNEYESFLQIHELTCLAAAHALPDNFSWDNYYPGVCRKMAGGATWTAWSAVSIMLVIAGSLMIFGLPGSALGMITGSIAFATGAGLLFLSYFCNCSR